VVSLSSKYNGSIKIGTKVNSHYFFDFLIPKLSVFDGDLNNTIEIKNQDVIKIIVNQTAKSEIFFETLLEFFFNFSTIYEISREAREAC